MAANILILYGTDTWLSKESEFIVGVFSCQERLDDYLEGMHTAQILSDYDLQMLRDERQTQGRETNYRVQEEAFDPIYILDSTITLI